MILIFNYIMVRVKCSRGQEKLILNSLQWALVYERGVTRGRAAVIRLKVLCEGHRSDSSYSFVTKAFCTEYVVNFLFASNCLCLNFIFLGFDLNLWLQHGHQIPSSHFMNIWQTWHLFCPLSYLPSLNLALPALCLTHIPLQYI